MADPSHVSRQGVEGRAELVVEITSPGDESREKLGFFAEMGVPEVLIIEPATPVLLRLMPAAAGHERVMPDSDGWVTLEVLPLSLRAVSDESGGIELRTAERSLVI